MRSKREASVFLHKNTERSTFYSFRFNQDLVNNHLLQICLQETDLQIENKMKSKVNIKIIITS